MNEEEAIRFAEDLESRAFRRGNLAYGNGVCFEEYWSERI